MASGRVPAPAAQCWLHAEVEVRPSVIAQLGLFARTPIPVGTVVCRLGGRLVSGAELAAIFAAAAGQPDGPYIDTITVGDDLHLVLPAGQPVRYGNHSCDPNLWWTGPYTLTARRPIGAGEEVTNDYATSTGVADFSMACTCRTALCRGMINGRDWEDRQLQDRYGDHWVPALLDRMCRS